MIGPITVPAEAVAVVGGANVSLNITDDLGGPKEIDRFYRWNVPDLTYSFDDSFVRYFGLEGVNAVNDAVGVMNDFFEPADGSYKGVTSMDFARDGFVSNFNTTWLNTTAQNQQIIDLKSLVLGMLVNQMGIGNPHRYAFTTRSISQNGTGTEWSFNVRLNNFDPLTLMPTDVINGVTYSYRLIHDAAPRAGGAPAGAEIPTFVDMEEFTTDTSGNAWTAVSGIVDAFYGNTAIYWTDSPTLFDFGVYYDGQNAMGGQYQPRHALTYDDAGGLKYLYNTNNIVWEDLYPQANGGQVTLVEPATILPDRHAQNFMQASMPQGRGAFPRRTLGGAAPRTPAFSRTSPLFGVQGILGVGAGGNIIGQALRGGMDTMRLHFMPLDSLIGTVIMGTNFIWTDTFISTNMNNVQGLNSTTPGTSAWIAPPTRVYRTQKVGRNVASVPDMVFMAADLGVSAADGVPIAWNRSGTNVAANFVDNNLWSAGSLVAPAGALPVGPGTIVTDVNPAAPLIRVFSFTRMSEGFEVLWRGETTVLGNQVQPFSLWGYIKGAGPEDISVFPQRHATRTMLQNELVPQVSIPLISMISDNGGISPIATNSFTRTEETISIVGSRLSSVQAIEVLNGDKVVQTIFNVDKFKVNDQLINIPPGVLTEQAEGTARKIRVWNTVGPSLKSPQFFNVYTGRAVVTATSRDNQVFDRAQPITIYGYGFKSLQTRSADGGAKLTHVRMEDGLGNVVSPQNGNSTAISWEVLSDTQAVIPVSTFDYKTDGPWRRLRASRSGSAETLSATNNVELITWITTTPAITSLESIDSNGSSAANISTSIPLRRDRALDINGTALNTAIAIEIVRKDGTSFPNPVVINLPNAGVTVDDNGTLIQVSANVVPYNDADGHATDQQRKFKVYNVIGNHTYSTAFNVNVQPSITGLGAFGGNNAFNREQKSGDDVTMTGTGLLAIKEIVIVDENGTALSNTPKIVLPHPGVTITDTTIAIDTQVAQFNNISSADSEREDRFRRFKLNSDRDVVYTTAAARFSIGIPPTHTTLAGISNTNLDYRRDSDTITFNGTGLLLLSTVEVVDINGNPITGMTAASDTTGVGSVTSTSFTLSANAAAFTGQGNLMDSSLYLADGRGVRRLRVTTPFGTSSSLAATAFTISATPDFLPISGGANPTGNSANTFAGSADFNGSDYNATKGLLLINGSNFRGLKRIYLGNSTALRSIEESVQVDPNSLPAGITINAAGTQISITKDAINTINNIWLGNTARRVMLLSAADQNATSPLIVPNQ
ncbi:MAG: hypothetical protein ACKVKM_02365 [Verrucomicrobiia bacterium]